MKKTNKDSKDHKEKPAEESGEDKLKEVVMSRKDYEELQRKGGEKDELWDKYLRLYADYDNSKKLWEKQRQELLKFGNFRILKEFVSIIDEIEAALANLKDHKPEFKEGLNMIYKKIREILSKEGLRPIETEGKIFDPHLHEALFFEERNDLPDHSIIEVIQKGYCYEDKVLRPAGVKVSIKKTENRERKTEEQEAQIESEDQGVEDRESKIENGNQSTDDRAQKAEES